MISKKLRYIDWYIMNKYGDYCDEAKLYKELQLGFFQWKKDNLENLVKEYINMRRLTR